MNVAQWQRAKDLFDAALDLPPDARSRFLHETCRGDHVLRTEVEELLAADENAGSFLDTSWLAPAFPPQPDVSLRPGDIVSNRFRIVRPLGDGGMGQVYEAHDSELDVQVALKTLRPEIASNPEVLLRFRQEVRIAHRITHPNVCRTFHLDREVRPFGPDGRSFVDLTFLTMEFLDGETLQQILKRSGRLIPARALTIARQMAAAIDAAHQTGIIHRDIKPANVMICPAIPEDRVVVTDFGLAKFGPASANSDATSISQTGRAMGTLAYMSPEQLEATDVGSAADIYAFGLVLFEMVTGQKAFPDSASLAAAFRRISEDPPSAKSLVPDLPPEWEAAIQRCLQVSPTARFERVQDVIAVLDGDAPANLRKTAAKPIRKTVAVIAALALCVSLSWWGLRLSGKRANAAVTPGTLVYLAPVKNETGEKQLDNVTELVRAGLSQSAQINLLDASRVGDYLQQMTKPPDATIDEPTAREIAMRAGAARVVFASVTGSAGHYRLNVDIQQPDASSPSRYRDHWPQTFMWTSDPSIASSATIPPQLASALRNSSDWIRLKVGESEKDILRLGDSPEDVTTSSWQALSAFTDSEKLDAQHKKWEAALALQSAVKIDPHFSLAYARLGDILFSINRDGDGLAAYKRALESSTERALSRKELDRVQGMYAIDNFDYETAIQAFRDYAAFYPNSYVGWAYPTAALKALKRDDEAIANLKRAVALEPHRPFPSMALADEFVVTGHYDEARQWAAKLRSNGSEAEALEIEATIQFLNFDFNGAENSFEKLKKSGSLSRRARSYRLQLRLAAEQGQYAKALDLANDGIQEDLSQGEVATEAVGILDRAALECTLKQFSQCIADVRQAVALDPAPRPFLASENILGPALSTASPQDAIEIRREILALETQIHNRDFGFITRLLRSRARGESMLAEGKTIAALAELRKVAALDAPANTREYLGRASVAAANIAPSPTLSRPLLLEALSAYGAIALRPNFVWDDPMDSPPGVLSDGTEAYLHIAVKLQKFDRETLQALNLYSRLRPHSFETSSEFQQARRRAS